MSGHFRDPVPIVHEDNVVINKIISLISDRLLRRLSMD